MPIQLNMGRYALTCMEFGPILKRHLDRLRESGGSANAFAKEAGTSIGTVSLCSNGLRSPPHGREEAWADALGLKGAEREEFTRAYRSTNAKAQTRAKPQIEALEAQLEQMRSAGAGLVRQMLKKGLEVSKPLRDLFGVGD